MRLLPNNLHSVLRTRLRYWRDARILATTPLFDADWYRATYKDVAAAGADPRRHYLVFGAGEGRNPGPLFETRFYLDHYMDVAASGINPLVHFVRFGEAEGRAGWRAATETAAGIAGAPRHAAVRYIPLQPEQFRRLLSNRVTTKAVERLRQFPAFHAGDYLTLNPDVREHAETPHFHAVFIGSCQGRHVFRRENLAKVIGERLSRSKRQAEAAPDAVDVTHLAALVARTPRIGLYASSRGNIFMQEIAEDIATNLRSVGVAAEALDEFADVDSRPPICIFVAPHEFFVQGRGQRWIRSDVIANSFMFNTEQVQTTWFVQSLPFILASRGIIDLSAQMTDLFREASIPSLHLTMGSRLVELSLTEQDRQHPLYRVLPKPARQKPDIGLPIARRPIDLAFFGSESPHREGFFVRHARFLADYETFIHYRRLDRGPLQTDTDAGSLTRLAEHVSGHAKLTLNLHRDEFGYFEWHRLVRLGMGTGSVVVSEPCLPHPAFKPDVHYVEATTRHMPDAIEWLLRSDEGRRHAATIQRNAAELLADEFDASHIVTRLLTFLLDNVAT